MKTLLEKSASAVADGAMCAFMNFRQRRHHSRCCTLEEFEAYLDSCAGLTREEFYHAPPVADLTEADNWLEWTSPRPSLIAGNERVRVRLHLCPAGYAAPTVFILHSLMSASDSGYIKLAEWFNARGWNAAFPHLPYHYSRTPKGYMGGELAVTANLIGNAENVRQCVVELRQLTALLRTRGCREFAVIATSWGGWNGSLLSFLEPDLRFLALVQPIVNTQHAIWDNPISSSLRRHLHSQGFDRQRSADHSHLSSPLHGVPLCGGEQCVITGGLYDSISPMSELIDLRDRWPGSRLITVPQGHFGYRALPATLKEISPFLG